MTRRAGQPTHGTYAGYAAHFRRGEKPCEACKQAQRRYYEANKDRVAEQQRRWREANKDRLAERQRRYYEANKDRVAERRRRYYEANKDRLAEQQRRWREANKAERDAYRQSIKAAQLPSRSQSLTLILACDCGSEHPDVTSLVAHCRQVHGRMTSRADPLWFLNS